MAVKIALIYDDAYLEHEQGPKHPERKERLAYTMSYLAEEGVLSSGIISLVKPRPATREEVLRVHTERYLKLLERLEKVGGIIDLDTPAPKGFLNYTFLAAGGAIVAGELVAEGAYPRAFAMVRPPGHHAKPDRGAGFCYLNNIAILAEHLRAKYNIKRAAILDWDAHFGDGTYDVYEEDPCILYVSIHQDPYTLYPGRGFISEIGRGEARGTKVCIPVPPGTGDEEYMYIFDELVEPLVEWFKPEIILVSAGQDCHFSDPITWLGVTARGYAKLMEKAVKLAKKVCQGKLVAVLEGGYGVEAGLPYTNLAVIAALAEADTTSIREPARVVEEYWWKRKNTMPEVMKIARKIKEVLSKYTNAFQEKYRSKTRHKKRSRSSKTS